LTAMPSRNSLARPMTWWRARCHTGAGLGGCPACCCGRSGRRRWRLPLVAVEPGGEWGEHRGEDGGGEQDPGYWPGVRVAAQQGAFGGDQVARWSGCSTRAGRWLPATPLSGTCPR
jgi:hypothetical protein